MRSAFRQNEAAWRMVRLGAVLVVLLVTVMGCSVFNSMTGKDVAQGKPIVEGFFGGVAGDDPRAVLTARSTLAAGGTAADAAVAYYFMSAVSNPATSSLGAGGVCISYDQAKNHARLIDFRDAPLPGDTTGDARPTAIPGAVRGMYALQASNGALPWADLVAPAERAARFGIPVSRGLAHDLSLAGPALLQDPAARQIFAGPDGKVLKEGDNLVQLDLGGMLSFIRTRGAGDFYLGLSATQFVDAVDATGVTLRSQDMQGYKPHWSDTYTVKVPLALIGAAATLHVPGAGFDAGPIALWSWAMYNQDGYLSAAKTVAERAHLEAAISLRDAVARAIAPGRPPGPGQAAELMSSYRPNQATPLQSLPAAPAALTENPASSGFAIVDSFGNAVSCVLTMNNLFGNGRVAPGTGIVLPAAPGPQRGTGKSLLPVIAVNQDSREVLLAGDASGGVASGPVMANVIVRIMKQDQSPVDAVAAPRVFDPGKPNVVVVEPSIGDTAIKGLLARGHDVHTIPKLGAVNVISCPKGLRNGSKSCVFVTDPRGFGLAVGG